MDVFVDSELESLLGMFNFDQCSSPSKEERPQHEILGLSSLYNDHHHHHHHHHHHDLLSHDHMFPCGENLPNMTDSCDLNHLQETTNLKRKLHNLENQYTTTNSYYDVTRQDLALNSKKRQKVNSEINTNYRDCESLSNGSYDKEDLVTSVKTKTRSNKGTATDPQSLYARKRREKINGRLKTLQNLVPNGTKVDISTMLEEAVHYVKFLQPQIKLLSSDDLWMYAPLAYNGLDMGFHHNLLSRLM